MHCSHWGIRCHVANEVSWGYGRSLLVWKAKQNAKTQNLFIILRANCRKLYRLIVIILTITQTSTTDELLSCLSCHQADRRLTLYSERLRGAGFRSVNPAERWCENPARALARAGFSEHLECGIHRSESSPEGSFALIPHPVARWAKTTP